MAYICVIKLNIMKRFKIQLSDKEQKAMYAYINDLPLNSFKYQFIKRDDIGINWFFIWCNDTVDLFNLGLNIGKYVK